MCEISCVNLRRVVPEANMFRRYSVTVSRDLFGQPLVTCAWGRIGTRGQTQRHGCETLEGAQALAGKLAQRQLRRGYVTIEQSPRQAASRTTTAAKALTPAAPVPARRRTKRVQQSATQLCLLTWLRPFEASAFVSLAAPPQFITMRRLGKPATPAAAQQALRALLANADISNLPLQRGTAAKTMARSRPGFTP